MLRADRVALIGLTMVLVVACDVQMGTPVTAQTSPGARAQTTSSTTPAVRLPPGEVEGEGDSFGDIMLVEVQITHVDDGDSLQVVMDGVEERVRLLGINAPERDECLGDASRNNLDALVGDAVVLGLEPTERDQFGRVLAHVFASDVYVNREQVASGMAIALSDRNAFRAELIDAEQVAEEHEVGLWSAGACGGGGDVEGVRIVFIEPDPPGRDEDDLDGEYVVIANDSGTDADLGGFVLRDESTANRFQFDDGFVLPAGQEVTVVTGCNPRPGELAWCADGPIWNNTGDAALLLDSAGGVIDHYRYSG